MIAKFRKWWASCSCAVVGHRPIRRILYIRLAPNGREILMGHDCQRCGLDAFRVADVDHLGFITRDATNGALVTEPIMNMHDAKGYWRRHYETRGWQIMDLPQQPVPTDYSTPSRPPHPRLTSA